MKLYLENIGKIKKATIEIKGITVIAGENNTGKSTVGKALFAAFNSFHDIDKKVNSERIENISNLIFRSLLDSTISPFDSREIAKKIVEHISDHANNSEAIKDTICKYLTQYDEYEGECFEDGRLEEVIPRINDRINVPTEEIFRSVVENKLNTEFNRQINNIFSERTGKIILNIKDEEIAVTVKENRVVDINGNVNLRTEAVYLDDPFILDDASNRRIFAIRNYLNHRDDLIEKIGRQEKPNVVDEILTNQKLEKIYGKISEVCSGDIVRNKRDISYKRKNNDKMIDVKNLSTGFKTFVILKTLLINNIIEDNGTIILDEPEIHLHPEWQLLFAEIIVLIQKEFGVHILLNTHSPYFLNAIEIYSAKYKLISKCKYYLSSSRDDVSIIEDMTDNIEKIYFKLAKPLQELENERSQL